MKYACSELETSWGGIYCETHGADHPEEPDRKTWPDLPRSRGGPGQMPREACHRSHQCQRHREGRCYRAMGRGPYPQQGDGSVGKGRDDVARDSSARGANVGDFELCSRDTQVERRVRAGLLPSAGLDGAGCVGSGSGGRVVLDG